MEAKNLIVFEEKKEDRVYRLEMPCNANLGEAYMACSSFLDRLIQLIHEHREKTKPTEEKEEVVNE